MALHGCYAVSVNRLLGAELLPRIILKTRDAASNWTSTGCSRLERPGRGARETKSGQCDDANAVPTCSPKVMVPRIVLSRSGPAVLVMTKEYVPRTCWRSKLCGWDGGSGAWK